MTLSDLVSHVRAAHSSLTNYICGVRGCQNVFKKTNTWYKHIMDCHYSDYLSKSLVAEQKEFETEPMDTHPEADTMGTGGERVDISGEGLEDDEMDSIPVEASVPLETVNLPTSTSESIVVGKLLKIKEHHHLSQEAISDVIHLVHTACDDQAKKAICAIKDCGKFFPELPDIFHSLNRPLAMIGTAYRQSSYISKNLPYVVSYYNNYLKLI